MLWLIILLRRSYTARTGMYPYDGTFSCAHCGVQCASRAFAEGFGTYTSRSGADPYGPARAYENAMMNYHAIIRGLFTQVACPSCGKFSAARTGLADHEGAARAESEDSRFTWAASVAGVLLLVMLGLSALDRSGWLAITGACLSAAVGLFVLFVKTPKIAGAKLTHPSNVVFWWNNMWGAPNATYAVPIDAKRARTKSFSALTLLSSSFLLVGSLVGVGAWGASFHTIYIVNTQPRGALHIKIDGKSVKDVPAEVEPGKDAAFVSYDVRSGDHVIEVSTESGALERTDLPIDRFDETMIYAPHAKVNGACLGTIVTSYQKYGDAPGPVTDVSDEQILSQKFDEAFTRSPHEVMLDSNTSSAKHTAIRVFSCPGGHTTVPLSTARDHGKNGSADDD